MAFEGFRVVWDVLVDLLLTQDVALRSNMRCRSHEPTARSSSSRPWGVFAGVQSSAQVSWFPPVQATWSRRVAGTVCLVDADLRSTAGDPSALIADTTEDLYRAFAGCRLGPHVEGCPHCVTDFDHARIYSRPLRLLTAGDLARYAFKAMTTWGDEHDFRHFLPRILELMVSGDPDWWVDTEVVLGKLARANWRTWPEREQAAVRSFLRVRWSVGLSQDAADGTERADSPFDADTWLCGVAVAGDELAPYIEAWRRRGATNTIGHVAAFLESNPDLLTHGTLGNAFWDTRAAATAACAEEMRSWLTACMDDPEFQAQLAIHYQS
jgi:hypothetical protein